MDYRIVAPSFVTVILSLLACSPSDYQILSIPFGPNEVLTISERAKRKKLKNLYYVIVLIDRFNIQSVKGI